MKKGSTIALLLVAATVLGATVLREPIVSAAQGLSATIIGPLDGNGNVRVHEQGTANVNVTNATLTAVPGVATTHHLKYLAANGGASDFELLDPAIYASLITITSMEGRGNLYVGYGSQLLSYRIESGHDLILPLTQPFRVNRLQVDCFPVTPAAGCAALINIVGTPAQ